MADPPDLFELKEILSSSFPEEDQPEKRHTGWVLGLILGVIIALASLPPVRYTIFAQFQYAIAENSLPFLHSATVRPTNRDIARFDSIAAAYPDDYMVQIGRATALATDGGSQAKPHAGNKASGDNTLVKLANVAKEFEDAPGAYAHLSRYMMINRVRLEREGVPDTASRPGNKSTSSANGRKGSSTEYFRPTKDDLRVIQLALLAGEKRDELNAFWPTMLATTYFADHRDQAGIRELHKAARAPNWDAYIYEEILGEWRLYSAAYGDNSAVQKVGPLSLISFPHLREIRKMAQFVRHLADVSVANGNSSQAIQLRRDLLQVGAIMHNRAQWAYEALIGTDVCIIGAMDSGTRVMPGSIRSVIQWEPQAAGYMALLKRNGRESETTTVRSRIEAACALRSRIDLARYDASFPGIPPGIPLGQLLGSWMMGVCLIQQTCILFAILAILSVLTALRSRSEFNTVSRRYRQLTIFALFVSCITCGFFGFTGLPSIYCMLAFLMLAVINLVVLLNAIFYMRLKRVPLTASGKWQLATWNSTMTIGAAIMITLPAMVGLFMCNPFLASQHPVASALTRLVDAPRAVNNIRATEIAATGSLIPLLCVIALTAWAGFSNNPIVETVYTGLKRLTPVVLFCLFFCYVITLNRTILQDTIASKAISEAARNDLQWVLTHGNDTGNIAR